jgi:uncharacterized peroxidase-related enzyme
MAKVERRISRLPVPERDEVPEDVAALFDKAETKLGFIPNVMRVMAFRPAHLMKWFAHYDDLMRGESPLTKAQREMIAVVVSAANRCNYCVVSHSAALRVETGDALLADFLAANYRHAPLEPRDRAMLDYAHKVTVASHEIEEDDLEELRRHGFSDDEIFDITEVAAMFNFTNRLASAFGWVPNELYHDLGRHPEGE